MTDEQPKKVNLMDAPIEDLKELEKTIPTAPIAPAQGIAALALSMAMKYHDTCLIKDGVLYQQYKLENRNIQVISLKDVLATAAELEIWLLGANERIAKLVVDAIEMSVDDLPDDGEKKDEQS